VNEQVKYGLFVRMAILYELLAGGDRSKAGRLDPDAELPAPTPIGEPA
jgi:hypothetical protein